MPSPESLGLKGKGISAVKTHERDAAKSPLRSRSPVRFGEPPTHRMLVVQGPLGLPDARLSVQVGGRAEQASVFYPSPPAPGPLPPERTTEFAVLILREGEGEGGSAFSPGVDGHREASLPGGPLVVGKDKRTVSTGWSVSCCQWRRDFTGAFSCLDSD